MTTTFSLHSKQLHLNRYPIYKKDLLQAWDAADEYMINYIMDHQNTFDLTPNKSMTIIGDSFGTLSAWFSSLCQVSMISDSYISHQATNSNLKQNQLPEIHLLDPLMPLPRTDFYIMRLPRNNKLLIWHLIQLSQALPQNTQIITTGKAKDIHSSTLKLFEKYLGPTQTSLAVKKSRLIFTQVDKSKQRSLPNPLTWPVPEHDMILSNHANVFSGESLDIGARFMLDYIPQDPHLLHIIDLGCGNGVLGIKAAKLNPQAKVTCIDESFMACASTTINATLNLGETHKLNTLANNALDGFPANSADLILCNPPFHQQNTLTDHIAWDMFKGAFKALKKGGKLRVIGNSHLKHQYKLKQIFKTYKLIASNKKFTVMEVEK